MFSRKKEEDNPAPVRNAQLTQNLEPSLMDKTLNPKRNSAPTESAKIVIEVSDESSRPLDTNSLSGKTKNLISQWEQTTSNKRHSTYAPPTSSMEGKSPKQSSATSPPVTSNEGSTNSTEKKENDLRTFLVPGLNATAKLATEKSDYSLCSLN